MTRLSTRLTVTDQFCGAGGSSIGAARAGAEIFLAINHWELAIETHSANFPETLHDCADVSATDPRRYPSTTILLSSPECTHHTYASGRRRPKKQRGLFEKQEIDPSAERSRATMWDVPRFAEFHNYEFVIVENVVEARKWAPFNAWMQAMDSLGYRGKVLYLNSMFFHPTPQSRDRMYVVFWKKGNKVPDLEFRPRAWCHKCAINVDAVQSWNNPHKPWGKWGRYQRQYVYRCPTCTEEITPYYYAAFNVIDWSDLGERIGDRDRPLAKRTMSRIRKGLKEYGNQSLLIQLAYSHSEGSRGRPTTDPLMTQSTRQSVALLSAPFMTSSNYFNRNRDLSEPYPTQTADARRSLVFPPSFFIGYANGDGPPHSMAEALLTQHGANGHGIVTCAPFLTSVNYFRPDHGVDDPFPTQTTGNQYGVTMPAPFIAQLRNNQDAQAIDEALSTVTAGGVHHALISPSPWLLSYYGSEQTQDLENAVATITSVDRHALVSPEGDAPAVEDCHFRMLQPHEIGRAMAFPGDYVVHGTKRDQVRQYGNAVTPPKTEWLLERCIRTLM